MVPVLFLLTGALWFILLIVCLTLCHFVLVFFSPFSIAITSLGEERANLSAFRTFDRFVLVWICRFPLPLGLVSGKGCGLWLWHSLDFSLTLFFLDFPTFFSKSVHLVAVKFRFRYTLLWKCFQTFVIFFYQGIFRITQKHNVWICKRPRACLCTVDSRYLDSLISNNRLSWSRNLAPVLTQRSTNRQQNIVSPLFDNIFNISLT